MMNLKDILSAVDMAIYDEGHITYRQIEEDPAVFCIEKDDFAQEVESLCDAAFIDEDGRPNWRMIFEAGVLGWEIYAGERDSFGWLSAVIKRKEECEEGRELVFG